MENNENNDEVKMVSSSNVLYFVTDYGVIFAEDIENKRCLIHSLKEKKFISAEGLVWDVENWEQITKEEAYSLIKKDLAEYNESK